MNEHSTHLRRSAHSYKSYRLVVVPTLITAGLASLIFFGGAHVAASEYAAPVAQATAANGGAPAPVPTEAPGAPTVTLPANAPAPVASQGLPKPVGTPPDEISPNDSVLNASPGQSGQGGGGGLSPWLLLLVLVPLLIAGIAYFASRRRGTEFEGDTVSPQPPVATPPTSERRVTAYTGSSATGGGSRVTRTTRSITASTAGSAASSAAGAERAAVVCPNCGSANRPDENFCHECGQDLRPPKAHTSPPAQAPQPSAFVADDTPFLETLDRVDEQLEFVLSRQRVMIGVAAGNDIVIDSAYNGWESVSPTHAELRREQDGFVLVDLDSENGTFVNEKRTGESILSDGDKLGIGDVRFVFRVPSIE